MNKKIKEKINEYKDEMIQEIIKYIEIDSVLYSNKTSKEHPYGEGVSKGFKLLEEKAKEFGFYSSNLGNHAMDISTVPKTDDYIGLVAHFDVVPVNYDMWKEDPFKGYTDGEYLYGRGSQDDKGPLIALLYAMRIIKELNIPLNKEVRLIVGGNEETGHLGIKEYLKHNKPPIMGFTADSDFPLTNVEKGAAHGITVVRKPKEIISINGGTVINAVAPKAEAIILYKEGMEERYKTYLGDNSLQGELTINGSDAKLILVGKTAHGSLPHIGINAITYLLKFVGQEHPNKLSTFVVDKFHNKFYGEGFDLTISDGAAKLVGQTSTSLGIIKTKGDNVELHHDIRFSSEFTPEGVVATIKGKYNIGLDVVKFNYDKTSKPLYIPEDSPLASILLNAYNEVTGENAKAQISGGGTYAKDVPNILAYGMMFPETESTMHAPDEKMPIRDLVKGVEIYIKAIVDLANK